MEPCFKGGYVQGMDEAMRDLVVELDTLIVGKPEAAAEQARQQAWKLVDPVGFACSSEATYYLSDAGLSRLVFNDEGEVRLSGVSTAKAKARWHDADVQEATGRLLEHMMRLIEREVAPGSEAPRGGMP